MRLPTVPVAPVTRTFFPFNSMVLALYGVRPEPPPKAYTFVQRIWWVVFEHVVVQRWDTMSVRKQRLVRDVLAGLDNSDAGAVDALLAEDFVDGNYDRGGFTEAGLSVFQPFLDQLYVVEEIISQDDGSRPRATCSTG